MQRSTLAVGFLLLILIQCTGGWFWGRRKRYGCGYPRSHNGNNGTYNASCNLYSCDHSSKTETVGQIGVRSDYFYGTTSLFKGKKRSFSVGTLTLKHSLLMFRGKIFEWGVGSPKSYSMGKDPSNCKISWHWGSKGTSKCSVGDAENWTRRYRNTYGRYRLFFNNCHHFVNRLVRYLDTNCGR